MTNPTTEQLEEEWLATAHDLEGGRQEYKQIAMMHAACLMSVKYLIDIRHFLWKVAGIKAGTYDGYLGMFNEHGVAYHITAQ